MPEAASGVILNIGKLRQQRFTGCLRIYSAAMFGSPPLHAGGFVP